MISRNKVIEALDNIRHPYKSIENKLDENHKGYIELMSEIKNRIDKLEFEWDKCLMQLPLMSIQILDYCT